MDVTLWGMQWQPNPLGCGTPRIPIPVDGNATNCRGPPLAQFLSLPVGLPFFTSAQGGLCGFDPTEPCAGACADSTVTPSATWQGGGVLWSARLYTPVSFSTSRAAAAPTPPAVQPGIIVGSVGLFVAILTLGIVGFFYWRVSSQLRAVAAPATPAIVADWGTTQAKIRLEMQQMGGAPNPLAVAVNA